MLSVGFTIPSGGTYAAFGLVALDSAPDAISQVLCWNTICSWK